MHMHMHMCVHMCVHMYVYHADLRACVQASSPDEGALVEAARSIGWELIRRTSTSLHYLLNGKLHSS